MAGGRRVASSGCPDIRRIGPDSANLNLILRQTPADPVSGSSPLRASLCQIERIDTPHAAAAKQAEPHTHARQRDYRVGGVAGHRRRPYGFLQISRRATGADRERTIRPGAKTPPRGREAASTRAVTAPSRPALSKGDPAAAPDDDDRAPTLSSQGQSWRLHETSVGARTPVATAQIVADAEPKAVTRPIRATDRVSRVRASSTRMGTSDGRRAMPGRYAGREEGRAPRMPDVPEAAGSGACDPRPPPVELPCAPVAAARRRGFASEP